MLIICIFFQEVLVTVGDKPSRFQDSKNWIGSYEVFLVLDHLFDVSCKILHVSPNTTTTSTATTPLSSIVPQLIDHFTQLGSPIMMGGDVDAASKCILGVCCDVNQENVHLLVLDPHFSVDKGISYSAKDIQAQGFLKWIPLSSFNQSSFYNLCLPLAHVDDL